MAETVWLLDVDGVLNFIPYARDDAAGTWTDTERFRAGNGFMIHWSPSMLARIKAIHESGRAEVRWLTTWAEEANELLAERFGLPQLTVAGSPLAREELGWWKLPDAQAVYESGVRVVWTDDDLAFSTRAQAWLEEIGPERMLAIAPRGGLLPEHLDLIEKWLS